MYARCANIEMARLSPFASAFMSLRTHGVIPIFFYHSLRSSPDVLGNTFTTKNRGRETKAETFGEDGRERERANKTYLHA